MGVPYLDAIIADADTIPPGEEDAYAERVLRLPHSYQPNDRRRPIAPAAPTRGELGLPDEAMVYACFNNTYKLLPAMFDAAWQHLRAGISFSNISSDNLAFVYENTLVTPETRKLFGTHSTPRQVAEYVVQRLELHAHKPEDIRIYEPFAGAGVFLVSALRHLRDLLPVEWSDQQRHDFLIKHISGDEVDPFACEVAKLSGSSVRADRVNRPW